MSIELKPCPFCGAEAEMRYHPSCMRDPSHRAWEVGCSICDARVGNTIYAIGKTRDEAVADWNTRAERTCVVEEVVKRERVLAAPTWDYFLSCEHVVWDWPWKEAPAYCPDCGAKVVE